MLLVTQNIIKQMVVRSTYDFLLVFRSDYGYNIISPTVCEVKSDNFAKLSNRRVFGGYLGIL